MITFEMPLEAITKSYKKYCNAWEIQCQALFLEALRKAGLETIVPTGINVTFYFKNKDVSLNDKPHTNKPDLDNLVKKLLDVLFRHEKRKDFLPCGDQTISKIVAEKLYTDCESYITISIEHY